MLLQTIFLYSLLIFLLIPLLLSGIILLRRISSLNKFELLFPAGSIFGITLFIFLLNSTAFFIKGLNGVIFAYFLLLIPIILSFKKENSRKIDFPRGKNLSLFITGIIVWGIFIAWKGNFALIGSDTNLYYSVAHSFIKGNFPPMTPWQPDLPLAYHLGAFELLGAFFGVTGLSFTFLHIFFSSLFIFLISQIIIWLWIRHKSIYSFIWGNMASLIVLVSFGFFKFVIPQFPIILPEINNFHQFFLWIRNLPTVNQTIEVYGAPFNLDALLYFIFHPLGLAIFFAFLTLIIYPGKKVFVEWVILMIGLITLSIVNESIFIVSAPSLLVVKLLIDYKKQRLLSLKKLFLIISTTVIVIFLQNGFISNNFFTNSNIEPSVLLFPQKKQVKEDFKAYHYYQQISKEHSHDKKWLPFNWYHIGLDLLLILSIMLLVFVSISQEQKAIALGLLISGFLSIAAYNFIIPRFIIANGNRFLSFTFIFLSLLFTYLLYTLIESLNPKNKFITVFLMVLSFWLFVPTILPPLTQLSKNRFGENKLVPKMEQMDESMKWMKDNLSYNKRALVLDVRAPHPSGVARALTQAGVFSPLFSGNIRVYTIEASPEYFDVAYYLSPKALAALKIDTLAIDSGFYSSLPLLRQQQLNDQRLFEVIFSKDFADGNWERIFNIRSSYFEIAEMEGTFNQFVSSQKLEGRIYIDNEENFDPSYLRRALIFSVRGKDIYYLPQSGVYLNVEASISSKMPTSEKNYDYLLLSPITDAKRVCNCRAKLMWTGLRDKVFLYKKIME